MLQRAMVGFVLEKLLAVGRKLSEHCRSASDGGSRDKTQRLTPTQYVRNIKLII